MSENEIRLKILEGACVLPMRQPYPKACQRVTLLENSIRIDYYPVNSWNDRFAIPIESFTFSLDSYGKEWKFFDDK